MYRTIVVRVAPNLKGIINIYFYYLTKCPKKHRRMIPYISLIWYYPTVCYTDIHTLGSCFYPWQRSKLKLYHFSECTLYFCPALQRNFATNSSSGREVSWPGGTLGHPQFGLGQLGWEGHFLKCEVYFQWTYLTMHFIGMNLKIKAFYELATFNKILSSFLFFIFNCISRKRSLHCEDAILERRRMINSGNLSQVTLEREDLISSGFVPAGRRNSRLYSR